MAPIFEKVGVIGAGQMGSGIALVCAQAGYLVALNDVAEERVKAALATINGLLARQVAKGQLDEAGRTEVLERIHYAPALDALTDRLRRLVSDDDLRRSMGRQAQAHAEQLTAHARLDDLLAALARAAADPTASPTRRNAA